MFEFDSLLYGLAMSCPLHNCDQSCPIEKIRDMPIRDRLYHLNTLSKVEKTGLHDRHKNCIEEFEAKYFQPITK